MTEAASVITVTMNTAIDRVLRVPGFVVGAHLKAEPISDTPAGKGINVSRAMARLGRSSTATGFVGADSAERFATITREVGSQGRIDNQLIPVPGSTRENITMVDPDTGTDTHLRLPGFKVCGEDLAQLGSMITRLSHRGAVVLFTGSLPPGMDTAALIELVLTAKACGADVALDLNGAALGEVLKAAGGVWLVSPNQTEMAETLGRPCGPADDDLLASAKELGQWAERTLLSLGERGAILVTPEGAWRGECFVERNRIISTVGAGDCLFSAVVDGFLSGMAPNDCLRHGIATASASIRSADPAGVDLDVVRGLTRSADIYEAD